MEECGVGEGFHDTSLIIRLICEEVAHSQSLQNIPAPLFQQLSLAEEISRQAGQRVSLRFP